MIDYKGKSELSKILTKELRELGLTGWLNDLNSAYSSRIRKIMEVVETHKNDKVVVFSSYRSCLDLIHVYLAQRYKTFTISATMNSAKRIATIKEFSQSSSGVLLLTYQIGAEGLNLQAANTCILADFWWNAGTTKQAIARLVRSGQTAKVVNIYMMISNTGIEKAIFEKHKIKEQMLQELGVGATKLKIPKMKMADIVKIITEESESNEILLNEIHGLSLN